MLRRTLLGAAATVAVTIATTPVRAAEEVDVVHWWTSGGEAAALQVLRQNLEKQGVQWVDNAVAGGGGTQARTVVQARVAAGNPPTAVQMLGFTITDWAQTGSLANLNEVAQKEGWDKVVPPALQEFDKYEGEWVAAPFNIHSTNWVWVNKALFDKVGGKAPTNFAEFQELMSKFAQAGITPIAHGGQPWQDATIFDGAVVSAGGPAFYKKAFIDLDDAALRSDTMAKAFDQLRVIRGHVDPNFSGRDWNLATAMVINGQAAMQIMGDWAKGEFLSAGKKPDTDFICFRYPGSQGVVTFNSDVFGFFDVGSDKQDAQYKLASAIMEPSFQETFNLKKGSVPARTDVSDANFDDCGKKGIADVKEAIGKDTLMGSLAHGYAAPEAVKGAVYDVVTAFFNSDTKSADAAQQLADAVAAAK